MIDWVKIVIPDFDYDKVVRGPLISFTQNRDAETDEAIVNEFGNTKIVGEFKGLKFIVFYNDKSHTKLLITGSLHKYFNNGEHNSNDFRYIDFVTVLDDLEKKFNLDMKFCILNNLEIGVNIVPLVKSRTILKGLLSHSNKAFKQISMNNADYYQIKHANYFIKVYDKAKQYRNVLQIKGELLRIELKYNKMIDLIKILKNKNLLNSINLTLADLKNIDVWNTLSEQLLKKWNEILFYDYSISKIDLSNLQKQKLLQWQNINYWESLGKSTKYKQRTQLNKLVEIHSDQLQLRIRNLIQKKVSVLLSKGLPFNRVSSKEKDQKVCSVGNGKGRRINSILIRLNGNQKQVKDFSKLNHVEIPDYCEWINDTRPLPF